MPIHAYTRLRSVVFYSRLAGMSESEITDSIAEGFRDRVITEYLCYISDVDRYAALNGFLREKAEQIKRIMRVAAKNPKEWMGMTIE